MHSRVGHHGGALCDDDGEKDWRGGYYDVRERERGER